MKFYLLENNLNEAAFFSSCLGERGHQVVHMTRAVELFDALRTDRPTAVVLELMLPEVDGLVTLRRVRELYGASLPMIVLSALNKADAIVQAFDAGADDYLLKPMPRAVLIARLESVMRRLSPGGQSERQKRLVISSGPYLIDYSAQTLHIEGSLVTLTAKELDLAWALFRNADRFISKAELIAGVWGKRAEISPHTVTQHVHVLRGKLKLADYGYQLRAVYGSGYRLTGPGEAGYERPAAEIASMQPPEASANRL